MQVRLFRPEDAERLATIFYRSVREGALGPYSQIQVEAWAPNPPHPAMYTDRAVDGRILLVTAGEDDQPIAYGDVELSGHIDHLFCIPEQIGKGAASMLFDAPENRARVLEIPKLFVEASEVARPFFERKGFRVLRRNQIFRRGVELHNYAMEKMLI
jgi:putative acetyltransferase